MKILVAEDSQPERLVLERLLTKLGHEVVSTADGDETLERFNDSKFSIAILDWMMPKVDGLEVCKRIREKEAGTDRYTYIIMVTAKNKKENLVEAMKAGVDDFIMKPVDSDILDSRIRVGERIISANKSLAEKNENLAFLQNQLVVHNLGLRGQIESLKKNLKSVESGAGKPVEDYDPVLKFGEIHLVECCPDESNLAYKVFREDLSHGVPGFVLSRSHPDKVKAMYQLEGTEIIWLSKGLCDGSKSNLPLNFLALDSARNEYDSNKNLKAIMELVKDFIDLNLKSVVLLEGIEYLFTRFSATPTMELLYELSEIAKNGGGKILVAYYPDTLDPKILPLLKREMNWVPLRERD